MKSLFKLKIPFVLLFSLLITTTAQAQSRNIHFFGSYNRSFGNITASVSSSLGYPYYDEIDQLRNGSVNQFEVGGFINSWGLGIIHNTYAADATTSFENYDYNGDARMDNGVLSDHLNLKFTGLEVLWKKTVLTPRLDVLWKFAIGIQSYTIDKSAQFSNAYYSLNTNNQILKGSILTALIGAGFDYHISKVISVGVETSLLPAKYKKLKENDNEYSIDDNVSRLSTGLKLTLTL
ncbi:MAG TPA: hypothetical protein VFD03_08510 [Clostridia bacterium]|nr:hypothetical protein [Clostridia bacterium]